MTRLTRAILTTLIAALVLVLVQHSTEAQRVQTTVRVRGIVASFATLSATGVTTTTLQTAGNKTHTMQFVTGGAVAATTCTVSLQGSNDQGTTWFDLIGSTVCTSSGVAFVADRPADRIRANLLTFSGGTTPTLTVHYAGTQ